jgi:hypothetical protein
MSAVPQIADIRRQLAQVGFSPRVYEFTPSLYPLVLAKAETQSKIGKLQHQFPDFRSRGNEWTVLDRR